MARGGGGADICPVKIMSSGSLISLVQSDHVTWILASDWSRHLPSQDHVLRLTHIYRTEGAGLMKIKPLDVHCQRLQLWQMLVVVEHILMFLSWLHLSSVSLRCGRVCNIIVIVY